MKNKTIEQLKQEYTNLSCEMLLLQETYDTYNKIAGERYKVNKELQLKIKLKEKQDIEFKTIFNNCTFPRMGQEGCNGSAMFENLQEAEKLCEKLSSYTYSYVVKYTDPGYYVLEPDYKYDHDNDIIYTATFVKRVEDEN